MSEPIPRPSRAVLPRKDRPTLTEGGREALDLARYAPFLLNAVSSAWNRETSAIYRARFGFGIGEWRVLAMVAVAPDIRQQRICAELRMNKSAASRSLALLKDKGLLEAHGEARRALWRLTDEGARVHAEVMEIALGWEAKMLEGVAPEDLSTFLAVMARMLENLERGDGD
ncbi:MarR family winged helix-turn-helix transcriptional regulator [Rhodovulum sp. DZ06]|uniref:MarR family winged helix-turn-helix transcriptional regulator n=1 Tax=Rhodovulum sp. DZ06 TaxID=3425126 RepID=UPI003D33C049